MKNSSDTIGNRIRNLPACSAVPQPTAPPRTSSDRKEVLLSLLCQTVFPERLAFTSCILTEFAIASVVQKV